MLSLEVTNRPQKHNTAYKYSISLEVMSIEELGLYWKRKKKKAGVAEVLKNDSSIYTEDSNFIFAPPKKSNKFKRVLDW